MQDAKFLSLKEVRQRLGVSKPVLNALVWSGLLGYGQGDMISEQGVLYYEKFGTQWDIEKRYGPSGTRLLTYNFYESMPPIESIGPQPPSTQTEVLLTPGNAQADSETTDTGWIAHFYLVPNYFFFPHPTELSLIGPPPLKLSAPKRVPGAELPVTLYPHPSGYLGLVVVDGRHRPFKDPGEEQPFEGPQEEAYDVAMPLLDELSARYDVPLPVAHSMMVGIPSGTIHLFSAHRSKAKEIERGTELLPQCPHPELRDAYALYREAVSSDNPFHAFLTFWKVYEEALHVRSKWGAKHQCSDTKVREEVFPELWVFRGPPPGESGEDLRGRKFEKAKEALRGPYRAALAHAGYVEAGKPLTGAYSEDYGKVAAKMPIVRYIANVVLENVRATLDAQPLEQEDGEEAQEEEEQENRGGGEESSDPSNKVRKPSTDNPSA